MATSVKQMVDLGQVAAETARKAAKAKSAADAAMEQAEKARSIAAEKADAKEKAEAARAAVQAALNAAIDQEKSKQGEKSQRQTESSAAAQALQGAREKEAEKKAALDTAVGGAKAKAQSEFDKATEDVKTCEDKYADAQNKLADATAAATNAEKNTAAKRSDAQAAQAHAERAVKEAADAAAYSTAKQAAADRARQAYNDAAQKAEILQAAADTCGCPDVPTPSEDCAPSLCLTFFDVQAGTPITLDDDPVPLILNFTQNSQVFSEPAEAHFEDNSKYSVDFSTLQTVPSEGTLVSLSLSTRESVGCTTYISEPVEFPFTCDPCNDCACLQMPLVALPATCSLEFKAYETSTTDPDDETLVDGVGIVVTAVEVGSAKKGSVALSRSYTGTTRGGFAVIAGLPQRQLFEIRFAVPNPYLSLAPRRIYVGCEDSVQVPIPLAQASNALLRVLAFVRKDNPALRFGKLQFTANDVPQCTDDYGVWHIPDDIERSVTLVGTGFALDPSFIDLDSNKGPLLKTVSVAEETLKQLAAGVKTVHKDQNGVPFAGRVLYYKYAGKSGSVVTEVDGTFEVEPGSLVYALDDEHGPGTEAVLITRDHQIK